MVKSDLIYFGNLTDSASGMKRAFPCFLILMIILVVFFRKSKLIKKSKIIYFLTVFVLSVVLCSALGVQLPKHEYEAGLYGFLVGCVIAVSYFCLTFLTQGYTSGNYITLILLMVSMSCTAVINFHIQKSL